jgi:taurine dioxygenase
MDYRTIEARKLTPTIGAEIGDVDLAQALGNRQFREIQAAPMENGVIFFRDRNLTVDQHKAFGARFGKLHVHPNAPKLIDGHPEILVIQADENTRRAPGEEWHCDVSCDPEPPMGSILYMHEPAANGAGDTMFANMCAAHDALSDPIKRLLEGMTAIHDSAKAHSGRRPGQGSDMQFPRSEHPVIRTHPVTGRKALVVNRGFTTRIVQLKRSESDAVLEMLYRHIETPEFHCRFKWRKHSLAFCDNRCTQHQALFDYWPNRRYAHRVTVCGDKPF